MYFRRHSPKLLFVYENLCYDFQNEGKLMKFKMTPIKICAALILGIVAFSFSMSSLNDALTRYEIQNKSFSGYSIHTHHAQNALLSVSESNQPASKPLVYLFHLLFILFIVSPPIIAVMLFLIWKELKTRNKMK